MFGFTFSHCNTFRRRTQAAKKTTATWNESDCIMRRSLMWGGLSAETKGGRGRRSKGLWAEPLGDMSWTSLHDLVPIKFLTPSLVTFPVKGGVKYVLSSTTGGQCASCKQFLQSGTGATPISRDCCSRVGPDALLWAPTRLGWRTRLYPAFQWQSGFFSPLTRRIVWGPHLISIWKAYCSHWIQSRTHEGSRNTEKNESKKIHIQCIYNGLLYWLLAELNFYFVILAIYVCAREFWLWIQVRVSFLCHCPRSQFPLMRWQPP